MKPYIMFVSQILLLDLDANAISCLNTGCNVILIDKTWLLQQLFDQKIKKRFIFSKVNKFTQFAELFFFFQGENDKGQKIYVFFKCKLHLVKSFKVNILIKNNIFTLESFVLDIRLGHTMMKSYDIKIIIRAR